jgi:hypothetical protein
MHALVPQPAVSAPHAKRGGVGVPAQLHPAVRPRLLPVDPSQLRRAVLPLPGIPAAQLRVTRPHAPFARGLAPFIVTGIMEHPAWAERERSTGMRPSDVTALVARFPDVRVACCPHNTAASDGQPVWEALPTASPRPPAHCSCAFTARCLQWNMDACAWRRVTRLLGPLPRCARRTSRGWTGAWVASRCGPRASTRRTGACCGWARGRRARSTTWTRRPPAAGRCAVVVVGLCGWLRTHHRHPPPPPTAYTRSCAQLQVSRMPRGGTCAHGS